MREMSVTLEFNCLPGQAVRLKGIYEEENLLRAPTTTIHILCVSFLTISKKAGLISCSFYKGQHLSFLIMSDSVLMK